MSILRGAIGLAALGVAAGAYRVMREAADDDPGVAAGALAVTAVAGSAAAHLLARERQEFRQLARAALPAIERKR
jgi:hypothetical protein